MTEFTFHCQEKMTIWHDTKFTIAAKTKEEALQFLKEHKDCNADELAAEYPNKVHMKDCAYIEDTVGLMSPLDNDGRATIEYKDSDYTDVCNNVNE